jgi:hypothetical protein
MELVEAVSLLAIAATIALFASSMYPRPDLVLPCSPHTCSRTPQPHCERHPTHSQRQHPLCPAIHHRRHQVPLISSAQSFVTSHYFGGFDSCALWLKYGLLLDDRTQIIVNLTGLCLYMYYLLIYWIYTLEKERVCHTSPWAPAFSHWYLARSLCLRNSS